MPRASCHQWVVFPLEQWWSPEYLWLKQQQVNKKFSTCGREHGGRNRERREGNTAELCGKVKGMNGLCNLSAVFFNCPGNWVLKTFPLNCVHTYM